MNKNIVNWMWLIEAIIEQAKKDIRKNVHKEDAENFLKSDYYKELNYWLAKFKQGHIPPV